MKSIKGFLLLLFLGIFGGACEDMLEPDKDNQYTLERAYRDPAFAEGLLLNGYLVLQNEYSLEDVATDNAVSNDKDNSYLRMATGEWSAIYNPANVWSASYDAIFYLNYFLSVVDHVEWSVLSDNRKQMFARRFKGEALALRAYYHMLLLINHGGIGSDGNLLGIPLVTSMLTPESNWRLPRNTYEECLEQINADFNTAYNLLPYKWQNSATDGDYSAVFGAQNKNRINGEITKALKARLALYAASPAFNNGVYNMAKISETASLAGQLLKEIGAIGGLDPQGALFYNDDASVDRAEILWRNDYATNNTREKQSFPPSMFGNGDINPTQNLVDAFPMGNGYPIIAAGSGYDPSNPYADRDPRLKAYILCNGSKLGTTEIKTDLDSPVDGLNKTTASTRTGYYMLKLLRSDVNLSPNVNSSRRHFYAHIRYTEIFLIYAEAANQAWGPDADPNNFGFTARDVVSALRKRAGISVADPYLMSISTKEAMADLIRNERRLELCFEGFRFWDLRRWRLNLNEKAKGLEISGNTFTLIDVEDRNYQPYMYYGPIPSWEVLRYEGLLQNQGW